MPEAIRPPDAQPRVGGMLSIPLLPDFGRQRLEQGDSPYDYILAYGSPVLLPGDRVGRILRDLRITPEQYDAIVAGLARADNRRLSGRNNKLTIIELAAESFPLLEDTQRDFVHFLNNADYRKQLKKREGQISGRTDKIRTMNPADFDPRNSQRGFMYLRTNKAFVHKLRRPAPVA